MQHCHPSAIQHVAPPLELSERPLLSFSLLPHVTSTSCLFSSPPPSSQILSRLSLIPPSRTGFSSSHRDLPGVAPRQLSLEQCQAMTENFSCGVLGRGSFGRVHRGEWVEGRAAVQVAVKRLDPESFQGQEEWMVSCGGYSSRQEEWMMSCGGRSMRQEDWVVSFTAQALHWVVWNSHMM